MRDFILDVEVGAIRVVLVLSFYILGQTARQLTQFRHWAVALGVASIILFSFDIYLQSVVLAVLAFGFGIVTRSPRLLAVAYLCHVGAVLFLAAVHFQNAAGFLEMDPLALNPIAVAKLVAILRYDLLMTVIAVATTGAVYGVLRACRVRRCSIRFFALIVGSVCCYAMTPFLGPTVAMFTAAGLVIGFWYANGNVDGFLAVVGRQGASHSLIACVIYFVCYASLLGVNELTGAWIFSPSDSVGMVMTIGITLAYGAILGAVWNQRAAHFERRDLRTA